jgi:glucose-6-phosphate isomerase
MLISNFSELTQIAKKNPNHGISESEFDPYLSRFDEFKSKIESRNQGFLDLPFDTQNLEKVKQFSNEVKSKFDTIVVLGIGGSMLGPLVILEALGAKSKKKVYCVDNIDPDLIQQIDSKINYSKTIFLVQTKSGTTPETVAQYFYFRAKVIKENLAVKNHFVFVTDPENGYLRKSASKDQIVCFDIPENVGGRFSVLSNVGLVLAGLLDIDIDSLLEGGRNAIQKYFTGKDLSSYKLAVSQFLLNQKGKNITVLMPYTSRLRTFAGWYIQLLSESIGKTLDLEGKEVWTGITPVPALGATDQHAQMQLFKEGPNDKLIVFLQVLDHQVEVQIPDLFGDEKSLAYLKGKSFNQLLEAEFVGTRQSLSESEKPNITISIQEITPKSLGELFVFFEISVAFLGEIFNINTFDQPGVERSKVITREILDTL